MNSKNKYFFIILAFLPILIYPFSLVSSLILASAMVVASLIYIHDEDDLKSVLKPLVLVLTIGATFLCLNFLVAIINGFGDLSMLYRLGGFRAFLVNALGFLNALFFIILIGGLVLIIISYNKKNKVVFLDDLIDSIMNGKWHFETKTNSKKNSKKEPEIIVENEDDKKDDKQDK